MPIVHAPKNNKQRKRFEASFRTWIFQKIKKDFDTKFVKTIKRRFDSCQEIAENVKPYYQFDPL